MKATKRRVLSFVMVLLTVITTVFGHVDYNVAAEETATNTYTKVTSAEQFTTGSYVMVLNTGYAPLEFDNGWITVVQPTLDGETLTDVKDAIWTLTVSGSNVQITDKNSALIAPKGGNNNGISSGSYDWAWSFDDTSKVFVFKGQGSDTVTLASNKGSGSKLRGYKNGTVEGNPNGYPSEFTLYKVESGSDTPGTDTPGTEDPKEELLVKDGTYVIYNPAYKMALSQTYTGYNNSGASMTLNAEGKFDKVAATELWTVTNNEDGTVTISCESGKLSMGTQYTSTPLNDVNDKWAIEKTDADGTYYIKNVARNAYLEWYASKNNFSAYYSISESSKDLFRMQFIPATVTEDAPKTDAPEAGSEVVIYNVSAKGILAAQDDNVESPSIKGVEATVKENKATAANGGVVFKVEKNGEFFRFYNETYGYLCSKGTGNNAYYSLEACDEADWGLEKLGGGFKMKNKVAKYNGTSAQYLEYYAESYKTYSFYGTNKDGTPADTTIYEFRFYECANEKYTNGIVNEPTVVTGTLPDAYVGADYIFTFEVDAPFGVKELEVTLNNEKVNSTEELGTYTVTIPGEKITGEKLEVVVSGTDKKDVTFSSKIEITVKDEPVILAVTPASGAETGSEKKPVISAEIANAGVNPTVVMTVNEEKVAAVYKDGKVSYTAASDMEDARYSVTVTVTREDGKTASKTWNFTVGTAAYQLYFGQLHSHTTYSDGSGSLQSALDYIAGLPESANVDFVAFTDHSNYFDKSGAANPEAALYDMSQATEYSQNVWKEYKDTVATFNASQSDVVALAGFEMTWSGGPGHINTFHTPGIVSRNNSTLNNKTNDAGMKAYYALLSQAEGADSISQFNHPGSTFGTFTDFSYWDALVDSRISLVEVGNGEGQIGAGGYYPSYEYYTMALDKGWHVAPTNNQDNHKGKWGNANDARDVILTDDFSEEGIYQAMRDMRMYATEDKNLELYYTVNGYQLGSSITEVPDKLDINVRVNDPDASDSISKVEVIVNSGKTAYTWDNKAELSKGELTCTLAPNYSYYYIRVTEGDGDLAVTAPVWVGDALKLGISSVECGTSTPVTNEELTLTTNLFNSESVDATVKSLTYTVNGSEVIGVDTNSYAIPASGSKDIKFKYTPTAAKLTKITVTAVVEQKQQEYTFTMDISLDVQDSGKLVYIGIDAAHYNEYVAGNYADSMGNFSELAAGYSVRTVELETSEDFIAACSNDKYKALILTAPSRRLAASFTDPRTYSAEEIAALVSFNNNGGCVILAGWSDFYENSSKTGNTSGKTFTHMAATQNEILKALGSSLRISDDATYDDSYNGGQQYRLYFNSYGDNFLTEGVEVDPEHLNDRLYTEVFSHYGGSSVYVVDENDNAVNALPETVLPVVYAHSTTYSVDADEDGLGGSNIPKYSYAEGDNRLLAMAMEEIEGKGTIIVSGAAFMSNFEVQATISDSGSEKNYSNYKICENLVQHISPIAITPIAEVQAQTEAGYKYTIEGIVTSNASGYDKDTAFFDCIYVQDETGGVCCFPVAGNYKIGDKVRVTGTTDFYQGEMELQVTSIEAIGSGSVTPTVVTSAQVNDGSVLGQLITVNGTVVSFEEANGLVQTIMVKDAAGNVCRVFIDGYITTSEDVKNLKAGNKITVTGIASFDDTFNAPDGPFPRIRIRNREDIVCTASGISDGDNKPAESNTSAGNNRQTEGSTSAGDNRQTEGSAVVGDDTSTQGSSSIGRTAAAEIPSITSSVSSANNNTVTENRTTTEIREEKTPLVSGEAGIVETPSVSGGEEEETVKDAQVKDDDVPLAAEQSRNEIPVILVFLILLMAAAGTTFIILRKRKGAE
ncbi:MAG: CehA/McbA family metallohydrolase [Agathobacter sp.]